jgi:peptidoglycan/LPS O-acetylase OafA/YrhL
VQLMLVPRLALSGESSLLALLDIHNINSLMYAMEHLAWSLFFGLATIFMGVAISGGRIETWIRWLFIAGGVMSILFIPGMMSMNQFLVDLGYYAAGVLLPITTILLVIRFRKS